MGATSSAPERAEHAPSDGDKVADAVAAAPSPALLDEQGTSPAESDVLDEEVRKRLAERMSSHLRERWRLLFKSSLHGQSFNRFVKHVVGKGPNIVVVRDTDGRVFGGFATESWKVGPKFHGGYSCFLFTAKPELSILGASGDNCNFMYLNEQMEQLPNGCAFGGTHAYHGLWLHEGFDTGESSGICSTFEGALFPTRTKFEIAHVEVWAVKDRDEDETQDAVEASVLERRKKDKEFIALAGREFASDNL